MKFKTLALLISALALCSFTFVKLSNSEIKFKKELGIENSVPETLYLPSGKGLALVSFGYRNALAHFLWFQTNNYFGKHYRGDRNYKWLSHYCNLVSDLNPKNRDYYQFCGTMLSWEANRIDDSLEIFSKAIAAYPDDWFFYYLRGFTYAFFAANDEKAKLDFTRSATLPNAHPFVANLASRKILAQDRKEDAIEFLRQAIDMASDAATKSILENRIKQIQSSSPGDALGKNNWNRFRKNTE